jgi:hypothetical protein
MPLLHQALIQAQRQDGHFSHPLLTAGLSAGALALKGCGLPLASRIF